jgi:hypothetical protein
MVTLSGAQKMDIFFQADQTLLTRCSRSMLTKRRRQQVSRNDMAPVAMGEMELSEESSHRYRGNSA